MTFKTLNHFAGQAGVVRLVRRENTKPYIIILDVANHCAIEFYSQLQPALATYSALVNKMQEPLKQAS